MSRERELEKLVVTLEARTAKYKADLEKARSKSKRFAKNTKKDLSEIRAAFAGLGVALATNKIIQATAKQERAIRQLEQGIKSTGEAAGFSASQLIKFAGDLQEATTFGDEDTIAAMSQLVTFTNITGEEFKRTTKAALDLSARMDQDLKTSTLALGKALNDPVANLGALSRSGIQFSKDQKELIKSFVETGQKARAQQVILDELERQFGGSAEAARDTFGGALEALKNASGDLLEADGGLNDAQQAIEDLTRTLSSDAVKNGINTLTSAIVSGFAGALHFVSQTINAIEFLAEEFAAFINGPAIGDAVRLEAAIAGIKREIQELESTGSRSNAGSNRKRSLEAELELLEKKLAITYEMNAASGVSINIDDGIEPTPPVDLTWLQEWANQYAEIAKDPAKELEKTYIKAFDNVTNSFSKLAATAIVEGGNINDVFKQTGKTLAVDLLSNLIKVGTQMLINKAFGKASETEAVASASIVGPAIASAYAPAAAAVSLATLGANGVPAAASITSTYALTSGLALTGMAHDGIDSVPKEGTWLLQKGERVLNTKQNEEIVSAMKNGGSGDVIINNYAANDIGVDARQTDRGTEVTIKRILRQTISEDINNGSGVARSLEGTYGLKRGGKF